MVVKFTNGRSRLGPGSPAGGSSRGRSSSARTHKLKRERARTAATVRRLHRLHPAVRRLLTTTVLNPFTHQPPTTRPPRFMRNAKPCFIASTLRCRPRLPLPARGSSKPAGAVKGGAKWGVRVAAAHDSGGVCKPLHCSTLHRPPPPGLQLLRTCEYLQRCQHGHCAAGWRRSDEFQAPHPLPAGRANVCRHLKRVKRALQVGGKKPPCTCEPARTGWAAG